MSNARVVIGPLRGSPRLHWTQQAAQEEAEAWATEMGLGQINWESADEETVIGRTPGTLLPLSILLPVGSPDGDISDASFPNSTGGRRHEGVFST